MKNKNWEQAKKVTSLLFHEFRGRHPQKRNAQLRESASWRFVAQKTRKSLFLSLPPLILLDFCVPVFYDMIISHSPDTLLFRHCETLLLTMSSEMVFYF